MSLETVQAQNFKFNFFSHFTLLVIEVLSFVYNFDHFFYLKFFLYRVVISKLLFTLKFNEIIRCSIQRGKYLKNLF